MTINVVAVANGRYFGGSMKIAPRARLDDGLFDVTIVGAVSLPRLLVNARRVYDGTHIHLPNAVLRCLARTGTPSQAIQDVTFAECEAAQCITIP